MRQAADGTCDFAAGTLVALDAGHTYTVTINDFMMTGGDGYPNVRTSAATQDLLDQDVADYLATLPSGQVTPDDPASDPLHGSESGRGQQLPAQLALSRSG